jgi:hypothetical protein
VRAGIQASSLTVDQPRFFELLTAQSASAIRAGELTLGLKRAN